MESNKFKLLPRTNPLLRQVCREVKPEDNTEELISALKSICAEHHGAGLAANQIGADLRIFVLNVNSFDVYINPQILQKRSLAPFFGEGCLSFPNEILCTRRYEEIVIRADNCEEKTLTGLEAIAFQHELDHLDGIIMHDRSIV